MTPKWLIDVRHGLEEIVRGQAFPQGPVDEIHLSPPYRPGNPDRPDPAPDRELPEILEQVKTGRLLGVDFFLRYCDGKFWDEDLCPDILPFVARR